MKYVIPEINVHSFNETVATSSANLSQPATNEYALWEQSVGGSNSVTKQNVNFANATKTWNKINFDF